MVEEQRKSERLARETPVWIEHDGKLLPCQLTEVSDEGARLKGDFKIVGNRFVLRLTQDGAVARLCAPVWRSGDEIVVKFLAKRPPGARPAIVEIE